LGQANGIQALNRSSSVIALRGDGGFNMLMCEFLTTTATTLARACGGHGFRATKPGELDAEINQALKLNGPTIVDTVVAADRIPSLPHIEMEALKLKHYALAKIRE
jgi:pyruvate dehydrogenase (quinone)